MKTITCDEAMERVWPSELACQLVGWMKSAAQRDPAVRVELERFVAALTPSEDETLLAARRQIL